MPPLVALLEWRNRKWSMLVFIGIWALFWNGGVLPGAWRIYLNHKHAQEYLRSGHCQVAEGNVEQLHPMPITAFVGVVRRKRRPVLVFRFRPFEAWLQPHGVARRADSRRGCLSESTIAGTASCMLRFEAQVLEGHAQD